MRFPSLSQGLWTSQECMKLHTDTDSLPFLLSSCHDTHEQLWKWRSSEENWIYSYRYLTTPWPPVVISGKTLRLVWVIDCLCNILYTVSRRTKAASPRMLWGSYIHPVAWKLGNTNLEAYDRGGPRKQPKHIKNIPQWIQTSRTLEKPNVVFVLSLKSVHSWQ